MAVPRKDIVDLNVTKLYHCTSRCVRRAFLCGEGYEHRKQWIEDRIELLAANFGVSVCSFSIMDNHIHVLVRLNPESSEHTSFQQRVKHAMANGAYERLQEAAEGSMAARRALAEMEHEHWLCPFEDREEVIDTVDLGADEEQPRKGMLPGYSLASYLELVDYTSRLFREGKSSVPQETPALLDRLKMTPEAWVECMNKMQAKKRKFGNAFAMNPERLREVATYRRVHHTVNSVT
jgi:REP element-mobilizing transposase RayT